MPSKSWIQLTIPRRHVAPFLIFAAQHIAPDDLYTDPSQPHNFGIEDDPHITLRYGLRPYSEGSTEFARLDQLRELFSKVEPFTVECGKLHIFEREKFDVLVVLVKDGINFQLDGLHNSLHPLCEEAADFKYTPHITLAYLKRGARQSNLTNWTAFEGMLIGFDCAEFFPPRCVRNTFGTVLLPFKEYAETLENVRADNRRMSELLRKLERSDASFKMQCDTQLHRIADMLKAEKKIDEGIADTVARLMEERDLYKHRGQDGLHCLYNREGEGMGYVQWTEDGESEGGWTFLEEEPNKAPNYETPPEREGCPNCGQSPGGCDICNPNGLPPQ